MILFYPNRIFNFAYDAVAKTNVIFDRCRTIKSKKLTHLYFYLFFRPSGLHSVTIKVLIITIVTLSIAL